MTQKQLVLPVALLFSLLLTAAAHADDQTEQLLEPLRRVQDALNGTAKKTAGTTAAKVKQLNGLRLEGVASGAHGGGDVAIVNGEAYQAGEEVDGHKILAIYPSYIHVENLKTREKKDIWVTGKPSEQEMDVIGYEEDWEEGKPPAPRTLLEHAKVFLVKAGIDRKAAISKAALDLRRLENAAELMVKESSKQPQSMADLVKQRYLDSAFFKDQYFYRFSLGTDGTYADPLPGYKLPHLFAGTDGLIRFEEQAPATAASPVWETK